MDDRRKDTRLGIAIPVRLEAHDADGTRWEEMTKCDDASLGGVAFSVKRPVRTGQVLYLSLPLPARFRSYDRSEASYRVYALVQSVLPLPSGYRVGTSFLGKAPPPGYAQKPGGLFRKDRRRIQRGDVYLKVTLRPARSPEEEQTVLENLGKGGARVMTAMAMSEGEVVGLQEVDGPFRAQAEVRNIYVGKDGIRRLNLRFLAPPGSAPGEDGKEPGPR
jgi:PilZ domain-containing protein